MDELVKHLRFCGKCNDAMECDYCEYNNTTEYVDRYCSDRLMLQAADAIEQLTADLERSKEWEGFWKEQAEEAKGKLQQYALAVANKPRWIPVTERLPKEQVTVLTWGEQGIILLNWRHDNKWCGCLGDVTNWMPLPEPPKEE